MSPSNPDQLASKTAAAMYQRDDAAHHFGMVVEEVRAGYARLTLKVTQWMLQGHDVCHGGILFALADTAMAYASNAHNEVHLAMNANIDFLRPANLDDLLTAVAEEGNRTRRTGMYSVIIQNQQGQDLIHFRGRTMGLGQPVIESDD